MAHADDKASGDLLQQQIPDRMTAAVVQLFEIVEIDKPQSVVVCIPAYVATNLVQPLSQKRSIWQLRQRIMEGKSLDRLLGRPSP